MHTILLGVTGQRRSPSAQGRPVPAGALADHGAPVRGWARFPCKLAKHGAPSIETRPIRMVGEFTTRPHRHRTRRRGLRGSRRPLGFLKQRMRIPVTKLGLVRWALLLGAAG